MISLLNHIANPFTYTHKDGKQASLIQSKAARITLVAFAYVFALPTLGISLLAFYASTALKKYKITHQPNHPATQKTKKVGRDNLSPNSKGAHFNGILDPAKMGIRTSNSIAQIQLTDTSQLPNPRLDKNEEMRRMGVRNATMQRITHSNILGGPQISAQGYANAVSYKANNPQLLNPADYQTARDVMSHVYLFKSSKSQNSTRFPALFGSRDVLVTPCRMDYNAQWNPNPPDQKTFHMLNAAAINVGEGNHPEDLRYYCLPGTYQHYKGSLDETKFLQGTGEIAESLLTASQKFGLNDVVFFPIGMGAFLRNLPSADAAYQDPAKMRSLRNGMAKQVAAKMENQLRSSPNLVIHLALPTGPSDEAKENYNAFIQAVSEIDPAIRQRVIVYPNADATEIAQAIANQKGDYSVGLINGANKNLLGNHWFEDGALTAIDENIHRRSQISAFACLFCNGTTPSGHNNRIQRQMGELEQRILYWTQGANHSHIINT
jgi:hypothetical protein